MARATKASLKKIRAVIEEIKRMLESETSGSFKSVDKPLEPGETRSDRYPMVVTAPNNEENKAMLKQRLEAMEAEEQRILAELKS